MSWLNTFSPSIGLHLSARRCRLTPTLRLNTTLAAVFYCQHAHAAQPLNAYHPQHAVCAAQHIQTGAGHLTLDLTQTSDRPFSLVCCQFNSLTLRYTSYSKLSTGFGFRNFGEALIQTDCKFDQAKSSNSRRRC